MSAVPPHLVCAVCGARYPSAGPHGDTGPSLPELRQQARRRSGWTTVASIVSPSGVDYCPLHTLPGRAPRPEQDSADALDPPLGRRPCEVCGGLRIAYSEADDGWLCQHCGHAWVRAQDRPEIRDSTGPVNR